MEQVLRKTGWMIGDPDQCIRWLQNMDEQTGGLGGLMITSSADWARREDSYHSLELFAKYVMPEFKGSNRGTKRAFDRLVEDNAAGRLPPPPASSGVSVP
jgi:limonene 1,2-monooxygenase